MNLLWSFESCTPRCTLERIVHFKVRASILNIAQQLSLSWCRHYSSVLWRFERFFGATHASSPVILKPGLDAHMSDYINGQILKGQDEQTSWCVIVSRGFIFLLSSMVYLPSCLAMLCVPTVALPLHVQCFWCLLLSWFDDILSYTAVYKNYKISFVCLKFGIWLDKNCSLLSALSVLLTVSFSFPFGGTTMYLKSGRKPPGFMYAQCQMAWLVAQTNWRSINDDVDHVLNYLEEEAKRLSKTHKQSIPWFLHQFYQGGRVVRTKWCVSVFNAAKQIDGFLNGLFWNPLKLLVFGLYMQSPKV